ncbi:glycosyltransferase family 61 protein [Teichococcus aestuarii]|uniref:Glycosyltransferase 61 catalytic domain-containing protein n=1 Tax=Teichococcus aestuarii TaxID=568898 RepID=A0A2U1V1Q3_9PROT|nr:glycosyltransferase family 61 protein [Pseudoroseomonas aestuarii]PWC27830.1 hypothetical protein CR165_16175 [Pseudoroseomonas aestuarii]
MQVFSLLVAGSTLEAIRSLPPAAIAERLQAMIDRSDAEGLTEFLGVLPDDRIPPEALPLLVQAARKLALPAVLERALALGSQPALSASLRTLLMQKLMESRDEAFSLGAWRVLTADPAIFASRSAANALRWLAILRLRLPAGAVRDAATDLLARHRDATNTDLLDGVELRERLRMLAEAKDWSGVCALAATVPERHLTGDAPDWLLTAALQRGDAAIADRALGLLEEALAVPQRRIWVARQLAAADMVARGWAVLDLPAFLARWPDLKLALLEALPVFLARARGPLRVEIRSAFEQLSAPRLDPVRTIPFPVGRFPAEPPAGVWPVRVLRSAGVSEAQAATFARIVEDHARRVERSRAAEDSRDVIRWPELQVYQDVWVDRLGRVGDAAGRVAPLLQAPSVAGLPPPPEGAAFFPEAAVASMPRNFFHWFAEGFPALAWRFRQDAPAVPILTNAEAAGFMRETLDLLSDVPPVVEVVQDTVRVGRALTAYRGSNVLVHWSCFGELYGRLVARARERGTAGAAGPLLYLSRRAAASRRLENEAALEEALARLGFTPVVLEKHSLADQICILGQAEAVVAPHGAGLAHIAAARPGLKVFEMMPARVGAEPLRAAFARLSVTRGHRHLLWLEQAHPLADRWRVDIPAMLEALRRFLEETPAR